MSASTFGTTYWLDDYWGSYFQPDAGGGVIVGTLAGSAAGVATVTGSLRAEEELGGTLRGRRWPRRSRPLWERERELELLREQTVEAIKIEEIALSSGPPKRNLAKAIRDGAREHGFKQPFDQEGGARLAALVVMAQQLNTMLALIQAQQDEEEEELLLLAA
jgi:hypothetical protein